MFELTKRPIGLDELADVRYLHASSFQVAGAKYHSEEEIQAFLDRIHSIEYIQECLNCSLYGLWHDTLLIGTSGWCPASDNKTTARMRKIYVHNFYLGLGLGRMLVNDAEERAKNAGFQTFSVRASAISVQFFLSIGYDLNSHGALSLANHIGLPVVYMRKEAVRTAEPPTPNSINVSHIEAQDQNPLQKL